MITVNFPPNISSLTAPGLTQYDIGQIISMTGTGITTETVQVHFAASGQSGAIVKTGTVLGGVITAEIPDSVLAMGRTITAWAYVIDGDARETRYTAVLPVVNRARPQDYISPAEPPYLTANELNDRVETAETTVTALTTELTTARNGELSLDARLDGMDLAVGDRYTKAEADAKSLKLKNMIANGDFSQGTSGWSGYAGGVITASNGTAIITGTSTYYSPGILLGDRNLTTVNGHVFYTRVRARVTNSVASQIRLRTYYPDAVDVRISSPVQNQWYTISMTSVLNTNSYLEIASFYTDGGVAVDKVMEVQHVSAINLTSIFGAGNEPTKTEMDKLVDMIGWFDGEITLEEKQLAIWTLNLIRQNRNAIIALGGTII